MAWSAHRIHVDLLLRESFAWITYDVFTRGMNVNVCELEAAHEVNAST